MEAILFKFTGLEHKQEQQHENGHRHEVLIEVLEAEVIEVRTEMVQKQEQESVELIFEVVKEDKG